MNTKNSFLCILSFFLFSIPLFSQTITLSDTTNQYDYIIITAPEFVSACETFKQHKETIRGFETLIVDTDQIFAEFDSSAAPQDNIRDFISYTGTFWRKPKTKFFLIAGSVQFVPNHNIPMPVCCYNPYHQSDYYFTQSKYESDSTTTEFYIGRIPAKNTSELANYFDKVADYESTNQLESWMNNNLFICEEDIGFQFLTTAVSIANNFPGFIHSDYITNADTSEFFGNIDSIYSSVNNSGNSVVWFEIHSGDSFYISPDYFNLDHLPGFSNTSKYFLSIHPFTSGAIIGLNSNIANEFLYLENAGSIGAIVTNGLAYYGATKQYQLMWADRFYDPDIKSIAEVLDVYPQLGGVGYYMKQVINLWADPSIQLKYDNTVKVDDPISSSTVSEYSLEQNYPNPFNPSTKIKFAILYAGFVNLKVYDILGNEVETLVKEVKAPGNYEVEFNAGNLPSGIYFYKLNTANFTETRKMILLK